MIIVRSLSYSLFFGLLCLVIGCQFSAPIEPVAQQTPTATTTKLPDPTPVVAQVEVVASPTLVPTQVVPTLVPTATAEPTATHVVPTRQPTSHSLDIRTAVSTIDTILQAIQDQDLAALAELVQYTPIGCTNETGMGGPPKCWGTSGVTFEPPLEEGVPLEVVPLLGAEGIWLMVESIEPTLEELMEVTGIIAIYEVGETAVPQYEILFEQKSPTPLGIRVETAIIGFQQYLETELDRIILQDAAYLLSPLP
ncbi:MAG: hypothetical protein AAF614_00195 [Chloroflexota bacterium]